MSQIIFSYTQKNKDEEYALSTEEYKSDLERKITNFMQELITVKGSSLFALDYGTTFLHDLGGNVNIYKVRYLLDQNYRETKDKYNIKDVETLAAYLKEGFLVLDIKIIFDKVAVSTGTTFPFSGDFTTNTIIEVNNEN